MAGTSKASKQTTTVKRNTNKFKQQEALTASTVSSKKSTAQSSKTATAAVSSSARNASKHASKGPELDVNSIAFDGIWKETRKVMGNKPIHSEDKNRVDHILRVFDFNPDFGPCVGMSRLERWERAYAAELDPPQEVKDILLTRQGLDEARYAENVLHDQEGL